MGLVLLIEDSIDAAMLVKRSLDSHSLVMAKNLGEAALALTMQVFDLILLDVRLPDGDGFEFFKALKTNPTLSMTPVIMLTAVDDSESKVKAYEAGVDDFITKPFCRAEFKARVNRRLVSNKVAPFLTSAVINLGRLAVDTHTQRALINGSSVELTSIEFKILMVLVNNVNQAIEREEISKTVWPNEVGNIRSVDTHVSKLRRKIGFDRIESVHGIGYRLAV